MTYPNHIPQPARMTPSDHILTLGGAPMSAV